MAYNYLYLKNDGTIVDKEEVVNKPVQCPSYALVFASIIPVVQSIGRKLGYAIAVHGSMGRDLDLIACPWTDEAVDAYQLADAIKEGLHCQLFRTYDNPSKRAHGRLAWSFHYDPTDTPFSWVAGPYIDLSVMPRIVDEYLAKD